MLLMIDNYDSFTYNLVQYFAELDTEVLVKRNDEVSVDDIRTLNPSKIVISPGPCTPNQAGISLAVIEHFATKIPILGVCLGHQCIAQHFGGKIVRARQVMHGKTSKIIHNNTSVFASFSSPFTATRYHSLVIAPETMPACLQVTAWTEDENGNVDEIMGIQHNTYPIYGVQFHPESILTEHGHQLLQNFLQIDNA